MIDRRSMLSGVAASCLCAWGSAQAQPKGRPARIAYISERGGPNEFEQAFLRGLTDLQYKRNDIAFVRGTFRVRGFPAPGT